MGNLNLGNSSIGNTGTFSAHLGSESFKVNYLPKAKIKSFSNNSQNYSDSSDGSKSRDEYLEQTLDALDATVKSAPNSLIDSLFDTRAFNDMSPVNSWVLTPGLDSIKTYLITGDASEAGKTAVKDYLKTSIKAVTVSKLTNSISSYATNYTINTFEHALVDAGVSMPDGILTDSISYYLGESKNIKESLNYINGDDTAISYLSEAGYADLITSTTIKFLSLKLLGEIISGVGAEFVGDFVGYAFGDTEIEWGTDIYIGVWTGIGGFVGGSFGHPHIGKFVGTAIGRLTVGLYSSEEMRAVAGCTTIVGGATGLTFAVLSSNPVGWCVLAGAATGAATIWSIDAHHQMMSDWQEGSEKAHAKADDKTLSPEERKTAQDTADMYDHIIRQEVWNQMDQAENLEMGLYPW